MDHGIHVSSSRRARRRCAARTTSRSSLLRASESLSTSISFTVNRDSPSSKICPTNPTPRENLSTSLAITLPDPSRTRRQAPQVRAGHGHDRALPRPQSGPQRRDANDVLPRPPAAGCDEPHSPQRIAGGTTHAHVSHRLRAACRKVQEEGERREGEATKGHEA